MKRVVLAGLQAKNTIRDYQGYEIHLTSTGGTDSVTIYDPHGLCIGLADSERDAERQIDECIQDMRKAQDQHDHLERLRRLPQAVTDVEENNVEENDIRYVYEYSGRVTTAGGTRLLAEHVVRQTTANSKDRALSNIRYQLYVAWGRQHPLRSIELDSKYLKEPRRAR